jgi:hypothetical protein
MLVFIKNSLLEHCSEIQISDAPCGLLGVVVTFAIYDILIYLFRATKVPFPFE